ncbi:MAG TPA: hypothetical protein VF530_17050 [Planctomycetota bacterium]
MSATVDFDVGGVLGVRLLDAGPREAAAVARQLGPLERPLAREPDITVRFVEHLATPELCFIGLADAGFSGESFLLLRGRAKALQRTEIPFEQLGERLEIRCERSAAGVPLLIPLLNATLLARGFLPLHAAAFQHGETGVVVTGWSKGGKTETLLAFLARGARYVADEWLILAPDGAAMFGLPEPIRLWSWHLDSLPVLRGRLRPGERARLALLGALSGLAGPGRAGSAPLLTRTRALLQRQRYVDVPPARLFPVPDGAPDRRPPRPERLLFVLSHARPEIVVRPVDPVEVAERMCASLAEEDLRLLSCYHKYRFAFPGRRSAFFEQAGERRRALLHAALAGRPAYEVRHPYPVSLPALHDALEEVCA